MSEIFTVTPYAAWLIAGMTAITFLGFRLGGYLMGGLLPRTGRLAYVLDRLPGFVLIALLAPDVAALGWVGLVAAVLVLLVTHYSGRALLAMLVGVVLVAVARYSGML